MKTTSAKASPLALSSLGGGSAAAHTPGPWVLQTHESDIFCEVVDSITEGVVLATFLTDKKGYANARLIAAAPDLLNALRAVMTLGNNDQFAMDYARAAIAKAEGGK